MRCSQLDLFTCIFQRLAGVTHAGSGVNGFRALPVAFCRLFVFWFDFTDAVTEIRQQYNAIMNSQLIHQTGVNRDELVEWNYYYPNLI